MALGSTLDVYPTASIPLMAAERGAPYVIVNRGETEQDAHPGVTLRLEGSVDELFAPACCAACRAYPANQPEVEMTEPDTEVVDPGSSWTSSTRKASWLSVPCWRKGKCEKLREEYDRLFAEARETARDAQPLQHRRRGDHRRRTRRCCR